MAEEVRQSVRCSGTCCITITRISPLQLNEVIIRELWLSEDIQRATGKSDRHCSFAAEKFRALFSVARPAILTEIICRFLQPVTLIRGCSVFPISYPDWDIRGFSQSIIVIEIFYVFSQFFSLSCFLRSFILIAKFCYFSVSYPDWYIPWCSLITLKHKFRDLSRSALLVVGMSWSPSISAVIIGL